MSDVYYNPEAYGLRIVAELDEPNLSYEFCMLVVWMDEHGEAYFAQDSGCSCPSPFENYHSIEDLTPLNSQTMDSLERAAREMDRSGADVFLRQVEKECGRM
jgi:hypothetical protein